MTRFLWWLLRLAVWLCAMDAMGWMLGVRWWHAMLIGFMGVLVEDILGSVIHEKKE